MQLSLNTLLSVLLDIHPEAELLDDMVILFSVFWGTTTLFPIVAASFSFLPIVYNGCSFSTFLSILVFWLAAGWGCCGVLFDSSYPNGYDVILFSNENKENVRPSGQNNKLLIIRNIYSLRNIPYNYIYSL